VTNPEEQCPAKLQNPVKTVIIRDLIIFGI